MIQPLQALSRESLRALAAALTGGSLRAPYAVASVARVVGSGPHLEPVAEALQRLDSDGMAARHVALLLEALAAERDAACQEEDRVQLVWTGPEAAPRDRDTGVVAAWLFRVVQRDLLVCSYALGYSGGLFDALATRMDEEPDLRVRLFINVHRPPNDTTAPDDLVRRFAHEFRTRLWPGKRLPEVWYDPRSLDPDSHRRAVLHAKCIVADDDWALLTSANLTEAAHARNIEAGVLLRDPRVARGVRERLEGLVGAGALQPVAP